MPAGTLNDLELRYGFEEFEAVAESAPLPCKGMNLYIAGGETELQPYDFSDADFVAEHGGNSGFADVNRMTTNHGGIAGIDTDLGFQLVTRMTAAFDHCQSRTLYAFPRHSA